jgi:hypothetical protein
MIGILQLSNSDDHCGNVELSSVVRKTAVLLGNHFRTLKLWTFARGDLAPKFIQCKSATKRNTTLVCT